MTYTFIVWEDHRHTETVNANDEDSAWELINMEYPDAEYIEMF